MIRNRSLISLEKFRMEIRLIVFLVSFLLFSNSYFFCKIINLTFKRRYFHSHRKIM